jgi:hypothetical protein
VANFLGIEQWQNLVIGNCVTNSLFIFYQPNEKKKFTTHFPSLASKRMHATDVKM